MSKEVRISQDEDLLDFLARLADEKNKARLIRAALREAQKEKSVLDSYHAGRILGSAEWLSAMRGRPSQNAGSVLDDLLSRGRAPKIDESLVVECLELLERIGKHSETRDRWIEAGLRREWTAAIRDLRKRLTAEPLSVGRPKRIRLHAGDLFRIDLPNGQERYGRLSSLHNWVAEIFKQNEDQDIAFRIPLGREVLEDGRWPIVKRGDASAASSPPLKTFDQSGVHFLECQDGRGREAGVRECRGLEIDLHWSAADVVERVLNGLCSEKLADYWPKCLSKKGELVPKCWSRWTEEDFQRMEDAAASTERPFF